MEEQIIALIKDNPEIKDLFSNDEIDKLFQVLISTESDAKRQELFISIFKGGE